MHFSTFVTEYIHIHLAMPPYTADLTTHTHTHTCTHTHTHTYTHTRTYTHTHTHSSVMVTTVITFTHGGDVIIGELSFTSVRVTVTVAVP